MGATTSNAQSATKDIVKVAKYSQNDLRIACDDEVKNALTTTFGYKEHNTHTDVKLLLGFIASIFAGVDFALTWKKPYDEFVKISTICIAGFFIPTILSALYAWFVQKNTMFIGTLTAANKENSHVITVSSLIDKEVGAYTMQMSARPISASTAATVQPEVITVSVPLGDWFDEDGALAKERVNTALRPHVEAVAASVAKISGRRKGE